MITNDPLSEFEKLCASLHKVPFAANGLPPPVHVVPRVMARIRGRARSAETSDDWTLAFMAAASCVAALLVAVGGLSWMSAPGNSLEALFQIVPPIGL